MDWRSYCHRIRLNRVRNTDIRQKVNCYCGQGRYLNGNYPKASTEEGQENHGDRALKTMADRNQNLSENIGKYVNQIARKLIIILDKKSGKLLSPQTNNNKQIN